jgi:hypothetical protein
MPLIDVNAIGLDDFFKLVHEALPGSFYPQNVIYLSHVVTIGFLTVNFEMAQTFF